MRLVSLLALLLSFADVSGAGFRPGKCVMWSGPMVNGWGAVSSFAVWNPGGDGFWVEFADDGKKLGEWWIPAGIGPVAVRADWLGRTWTGRARVAIGGPAALSPVLIRLEDGTFTRPYEDSGAACTEESH